MEISASGYTKELQQGDQLLLPVGPEGEGSAEEDNDDPGVPETASEDPADLEEFEYAMLELEGLHLSGEKDPEEHEATSAVRNICSDVNDVVTNTADNVESEEFENDDECPDLVDLSACNKEFMPFRCV